MEQGTWRLVLGDCRTMPELESGAARLVLTSPPFFSAVTEPLLREPSNKQNLVAQVDSELSEYADSLAPCFVEMARVCSDDGWLVVHTKNIRYGRVLLLLAQHHCRLAAQAGFSPVDRIMLQRKFEHHSRTRRFRCRKRVGSFMVDDLEELWVFRKKGYIRRALGAPLSLEFVAEASSPIWTVGKSGIRGSHPFSLSSEVARRIVRALTEPGDLVVDPFAGQATSLRVALEMNRRAFGYEIKPEYYDQAVQLLGTCSLLHNTHHTVPTVDASISSEKGL